jgi:hypothetical protein
MTWANVTYKFVFWKDRNMTAEVEKLFIYLAMCIQRIVSAVLSKVIF